jgi:hypothetical protein
MFILVILVNVSAFQAPAEGQRLFDTMAKCEAAQKRITVIYKDHVKIKIKCARIA